jgi:stage III sporulation protein AD
MELFIKTCGGILLSVILVLTLGNRGKDHSMVLMISVCCMGSLAALAYLRPVIDFVKQLEEVGGLDHKLVRILLKVTGIGLICEIGALVCNDSGCSSLGKTVKILGAAVILWLSLPLYAMLVDLLKGILGGL